MNVLRAEKKINRGERETLISKMQKCGFAVEGVPNMFECRIAVYWFGVKGNEGMARTLKTQGWENIEKKKV